MNDRTCADEADAGNNLCRNSRVVTRVLARQFVGKQREHGGAHTNEKIGSQPGRAMFGLALQPDQSAQQSCQ